jgi:hypothetical protein
MNARYSQVYGFRVSDQDLIAETVANLLDIQWTLAENMYKGNYYRYGNFSDENFSIYRNYDLQSNEIDEPKYAEFPILLAAHFTSRPEDLRILLTEAEALRDNIILLEQKPWGAEQEQ